ncbi:hypothetical protein B4135_2186 [Caldibacillus debilis]|uniref:Uncharacterized protein n=1 Tax=Caldibacillus debilis TaxID=301148 RepID=A0A150M4X4_9BACI|nr:hypothetical protein B4135_2186 [Caldibacillus debilis]
MLINQGLKKFLISLFCIIILGLFLCNIRKSIDFTGFQVLLFRNRFVVDPPGFMRYWGSTTICRDKYNISAKKKKYDVST